MKTRNDILRLILTKNLKQFPFTLIDTKYLKIPIDANHIYIKLQKPDSDLFCLLYGNYLLKKIQTQKKYTQFIKYNLTDLLLDNKADSTIIIDVNSNELVKKPMLLKELEHIYDCIYSERNARYFLANSPFCYFINWWIIILIIILAMITEIILEILWFRNQCFQCDPNLKLDDQLYDKSIVSDIIIF